VTAGRPAACSTCGSHDVSSPAASASIASPPAGCSPCSCCCSPPSPPLSAALRFLLASARFFAFSLFSAR